jgi:ATP-dependent 26S proteasome regulatory subunit
VRSKKKEGAALFGPKMKKIVGDLKKNKLWSKNDRISVICCTNKPYDATLKDCKKLFDKKIYFPFPNYATRKQLARHMIEGKARRQIADFPYETFAHVTEGFTAGSVLFVLFSSNSVWTRF